MTGSSEAPAAAVASRTNASRSWSGSVPPQIEKTSLRRAGVWDHLVVDAAVETFEPPASRGVVDRKIREDRALLLAESLETLRPDETLDAQAGAATSSHHVRVFVRERSMRASCFSGSRTPVRIVRTAISSNSSLPT